MTRDCGSSEATIGRIKLDRNGAITNGDLSISTIHHVRPAVELKAARPGRLQDVIGIDVLNKGDCNVSP